MTTNLIQTSFASGELSPSLYGRVDFDKYRIGASLMKNWFVDYRGGASTRTGTKFIARAFKDATPVRLFRFQFSANQAYILEFGDHYMRVISNDGLVLENPLTISGSLSNRISVVQSWNVGDWVYCAANGATYVILARAANYIDVGPTIGLQAARPPFNGPISRVYVLTTPWAASDLALLKYTQSNDVITFTHPNYQSYDLVRYAANNWVLNAITFTSWNSGPIVGTISITAVTHPQTGSSGSDAYYEYLITAVSASGEEGAPSAPLGTFAYNMAVDRETINIGWTAVPGAQFYNIYRAAAYNNTRVPAGAIHALVGQSYGNTFSDSNITPNGNKTPPQHYDPFRPGQILSSTLINGGTGYTSPTFNVADPTGMGLAGYLSLSTAGAITGFTITNPGQNYSAPVFTVTDPTGTSAQINLSAGPRTGTYPSSVSYFQQRRIFAASLDYPQTVWGTKPGAFYNMDSDNPVVDSDAFQFTLSSNQVNNIKWMVSMPGGLVLFTGSGVWQLSGGGQNTALTPTNAIANPQSYTGCSDVQPIPINYSILYIQEKGSIVRDLSYNFYANIYQGIDISVLSNHLFYSHKIVDWSYAEEPHKIVWSVRDDGILLALTYMKEQELQGWTQHYTQGYFESVSTIPDSTASYDKTHFIVRRTVAGTSMRYIEVLQQRNLSGGIGNSWFVDAGIEFVGTNLSVVYGLDHLEGLAVVGVADGVPFAGVVSAGAFTLPASASHVILGLGYTCQLKTLYAEGGQGTIQGKRKNIAGISTLINDTSGLKAGRDFDTLEAINYDNYTVGQNLVALQSGEYRVNSAGNWDTMGSVCFQQDLPLPATILSVVMELQVGN